MSRGADILDALKTRLETITEANSYSVTVKQVRLNEVEPTLNVAEADLPSIEIVDESEDYEHEMSSGYWARTHVFLYLVAPKFWTDRQMQDFMSDIRKALFGGSASATGNTGVTLGGVVQAIRLISAASDLNMIESNRVYIMRIRLDSHRTTYRD